MLLLAVLASCSSQNELTEYTVTFDAAGGNLSSGGSISVIEGDTVPEPEDPDRTGYTFAGWYAEGEIYDFSLPVFSDLTLVAHWEEIIPVVTEHTVEFFLPNGTTQSEKLKFGETVEPPQGITVQEGETVCWYLSQDYSGEKVTFPYTVTADLKFYGQYETATYPLKIRVSNSDQIPGFAGFSLVVDGSEAAVEASGEEYVSEQEYKYGSSISLFAYIDNDVISISPDGTMAYTGNTYHCDPVYAVKHEVSSFTGDEISLNMVQVTSDISYQCREIKDEEFGSNTVFEITISGLATSLNLLNNDSVDTMESQNLEYKFEDARSSSDVDIHIMALGFKEDVKCSVSATGLATASGVFSLEDETIFSQSKYKPVDISNEEDASGVIVDPGWGKDITVGF